MKIKFWRRKEKVEEIPREVAQQEDSLRELCREFERPDLYEPLSWIINLEPRGRDIVKLLAEGRSIDYSIAANVMLYEGETDQAREYFEKALELAKATPTSYRHLSTHIPSVIDNLDAVSKIARMLWEKSGKYEST